MFFASAAFFITAGFLRAAVFLFAAGFFFATNFFPAAFLTFLTTDFFLAADFFAGLDFLADCDLPRFALPADFLFLAMDCLLSNIKKAPRQSAVNLATAAGANPAVSDAAARNAAHTTIR